ncbi:MAG: hypothetical protein K9H26_19410 [Prolixibacteraceae bacterium]|nr:hypothetical protein [Prolixibacteraceae bacterium]
MKNTIKINSNNYFIIIAILILGSCTGTMKIEKMPDDFDFIAKYGIAEENIINTFDNTFTKKINWDTDTTISLIFPNDEKEKVYKKIKKYSIEELPTNFKPRSIKDVSPSPTYYLKFKMNDTIHEVIWETNTLSKEKRAKRLRAVITQINSYLITKEAVANLPEDERITF